LVLLADNFIVVAAHFRIAVKVLSNINRRAFLFQMIVNNGCSPFESDLIKKIQYKVRNRYLMNFAGRALRYSHHFIHIASREESEQ